MTLKAQHCLAPTKSYSLLMNLAAASACQGEPSLMFPQPTSQQKEKGAFIVRAPQLWNTLPEELRLANSFLKTYFYRNAFFLEIQLSA